MLVDVETRTNDLSMSMIVTAVAIASNRQSQPRRVAQGMYECGHWNFEIYLPSCNEYPNLPISPYGVCDSPQQLLDVAPWLATDPRPFVVALVKITKAEEPPCGGWRWYKWGEYIGAQNPQCEYLADEPDIDEAWTYHIYELTK